MGRIIVQTSDGHREYILEPLTTIGRHPHNVIQILDRIVSKEHAQIIRQPNGRFLYRDLGSLNGSFLGDSRIGDHVLSHGDKITLGGTNLVYLEQERPIEKLEKRVSIEATAASDGTFIQQKLGAESAAKFLPEWKITDPESLRADYEKLRLAHELGRSISLEVDIDLLIEKILKKAFELLPADRGVILLMEQGVPRPRVARTRDGRNEQIILSRSILSEVVQHKNAVLSSDASADSRFQGSRSIIMQGIRSTMTVPLLHQGQLLGIMHLDSMVATNAFGEKDLQIFASIATQAAIAIHNSMLALKIEREAKTRAQFQRLLSPNLVEQVVAGNLQLEKGGALTEVTMLFSDIRGFTAMSEMRAPQEIVRMLNEYFELMVDVIFKHDGTLDKFVGDEIVALFGAPVPLKNAEIKAVECALDMQQALAQYNRSRIKAGQEAIHIGIGINTGPVVTGAIGSSRALQYTAIGDAVNTASRLCSVAKSDQILLSEATHKRVQPFVASAALDPVRVKGKTEKLQIWNVTGMRAPDWRAEITKPA
jgi:adenylate cyclase